MTQVSPQAITRALAFRHACKKFSITKKLSDKDIELLLEVARQAPSSYGLEPWNIIVAQDSSLRDSLIKYCGLNGPRFDASHVLIFTAKTSRALQEGDHIKHMLRDIKKMGNVKATVYKTFWKNWAKKDFMLLETPDGLHQWAARQAYIALGFVLLAAAERGIDSCPIEGFNINGASQTLANVNLIDPASDQPVVMLALGYRVGKVAASSRRPIDEVTAWY